MIEIFLFGQPHPRPAPHKTNIHEPFESLVNYQVFVGLQAECVAAKNLENLLVMQESVLEIGDAGLRQKLGTG